MTQRWLDSEYYCFWGLLKYVLILFLSEVRTEMKLVLWCEVWRSRKVKKLHHRDVLNGGKFKEISASRLVRLKVSRVSHCLIFLFSFHSKITPPWYSHGSNQWARRKSILPVLTSDSLHSRLTSGWPTHTLKALLMLIYTLLSCLALLLAHCVCMWYFRRLWEGWQF